MKKINKKVIILLILFISIGFAYLSTNLNIIGITNVKGNTWDIHFENVQVLHSVEGNPTPTIDTAKTTVNYTANLNLPGDYFEFTVDVVNAGSLDAMIEDIVTKINDTDISNLPDYLDFFITYADGTELENNQILEASKTETIKIKVEFIYDIDNQELPSTDSSFNFKTTVKYTQSDENATAVNHPHYGYTVNFAEGYKTDLENTVIVSEKIPEKVIEYNNSESAINSFMEQVGDGKRREFYLKHLIAPDTKWCIKTSDGRNSCDDNFFFDTFQKCRRYLKGAPDDGITYTCEKTVTKNAVKESYVEFNITDEMVLEDSNLKKGTYTLRGGINEYRVEIAENFVSIFEENKATLIEAFGQNNCSNGNGNYFYCTNSKMEVNVEIWGTISVRDHDYPYSCDIFNEGLGFSTKIISNCGSTERLPH